HHFSNREQFLQLKSTYETLWKNNVIPIANENDVVSNKELKFSDNDELATLIAAGFGAEKLLLCTSVPGVLAQNGEVIKQSDHLAALRRALARKDQSSVGLGGRTSKRTFARVATMRRMRVVMSTMQGEDKIIQAGREQRGTSCVAQTKKVSSQRKWMASASL